MDEVKLLPCDVRVPPNTLISAGCSFETLILALEMKGRPRHFSKRQIEATRPPIVTDEVVELRRLVELYRDIFSEITAKAQPECADESDPERITSYWIPVGPIHRAAGRIGFQMFDGEAHIKRLIDDLAEARAALATIPEQAAWWMIERHDDPEHRPLYFCWVHRPGELPQTAPHGQHGWTPDWQRGEHFATREEAEAHTNGDPMLRVCDHAMMQVAAMPTIDQDGGE